MSEPKISGEVEDVLSSIRRLVADEGRPAGAAAPDAGPGKLILTPALRVVPPEPAVAAPSATEAEGDAGERPDPAAASEGAADATVVLPVAGAAPDLVASIGAAADLGGTIWESETGDPWSADRDSAEVAAVVLSAVSELAVSDLTVPEVTQAVAAETGSAEARAAEAGSDAEDTRLAALFPDAGLAEEAPDAPLKPDVASVVSAEIAAEAAADALAAPDAADDAGPAEPMTMVGPDITVAMPVAEDPFALPAAAADTGDDPFAPAPGLAPAGLSADPADAGAVAAMLAAAASAAADLAPAEAAVEPAVAGPVADLPANIAPVPPDPAPAAETETAPFSHRAQAPMPPPAAPFLAIEDEDGPLDEEALRDLVRDLIREEFQGPLGERITRNLRKLVRAEVQRALTTRALD